jgi:hypothetical protein
MYTIIAPVPADLAAAIEPYRQKYDPLAGIAPPHIALLDPFHFSGPLENLYHHLNEVGENHAPIKVFLIGWHVHAGKEYQLHLPMTAGQRELAALRADLLTGLLSSLATAETAYQPHLIFGRLASQTELEQAKKALKSFELRFQFRIERLELLRREAASQPWRLDKKFSLKATVAGLARQRSAEVKS